MARASGDLTFLDPTLNPTPGDRREIIVLSILPSGTRGDPIISSELPFVTVANPRVETRPHGTQPDVSVSIHRFEVRLSDDAPADFRGELTVIDPWVLGHRIPMFLEGKTRPTIRVSPTRVILHQGSPERRDGYAQFTVFTRHPESARVVVRAMDDNSGLEVERKALDDAGQFATFVVRPRPQAMLPPADHELGIGFESETPRASVLVRVLEAESP